MPIRTWANANDLAEKGRGVAIYVRDDLCCNQLYIDSVYKDFVLLQLQFGVNKRLIIGNFYRSPNSVLQSDAELYSLINHICTTYTDQKIFVGDFNYAHVDWASVSGIKSLKSLQLLL